MLEPLTFAFLIIGGHDPIRLRRHDHEVRRSCCHGDGVGSSASIRREATFA
jgi:hypothetical protein